MNLKEFKIFCKEYLISKKIAYRVFTINEELKFSIASEIPPMYIDVGIFKGDNIDEREAPCYIDEENFKSFLNNYNLTIDDLRFTMEERMIREL